MASLLLSYLPIQRRIHMKNWKRRSEAGVGLTEYVIVVTLVTATVFFVYPAMEPYLMDSSGEVGAQDGENQATLAGELGVTRGAGSPSGPAAPAAYVPTFTVLPSGGIRLTTIGSPVFSILGSAITYGAGGPQCPVSLTVVVDGAPQLIFKGTGSQVTPTSGAALNNLPAGTLLHFEGKSFNPNNGSGIYTQRTSTSSPMVLELRNGDYVPDITPFDQQPQITAFLTPVINPQTKIVSIQSNQVLYLVELGTTNTSNPAADFQDLVFLATF